MDKRDKDALVERAVVALRGIVVGADVEQLARVGEYLIEHFFGGDVGAARSRTPRKPESLGRLSARAGEFGMTATGVRVAVPMALQVRAFGRALSLRLPATHHRELLVVRDPDEKLALAVAAADGGWTVEALRRRVRGTQPLHRGGRPPRPLLARAIDRAARSLDGDALPGDPREHLEALSPLEARRALARVGALQSTLLRLEKLLTRSLLRAA